MVTLKDVAKECGVSFSTVSKALKGSPEISAEKTKMIQKKASKMGYHPNIAARTLRTNRTYNIGVIFEDKTGSGFQHQYFAKIISGIQDVLQEKGYDITFTPHLETENYDYYNHAKSRGFDGVIILSTDYRKPSIKKLVKSEIPTVTLDYFYDKSHTCVMSDNSTGMKELTEYVISQGHTKIALVYGEDTLVTTERKQAFLYTCKLHNIEVKEEYLAPGIYHDPESSAKATLNFMNLPEKPTCIIYPDDYSALGGLHELNKIGFTAGKDISIVGYDGIMLTSMMIPPLSTYEQNGSMIGREMASSLIRNIEDPSNYKPQIISISGRILQGGTVLKI